MSRGAASNVRSVRAGEASETARRVAAHRLTFERVPAPYGDPAADEALSRDVAGPLTGHRPETRMSKYLAARTAFFDRVVVGAIERRVTQIVVAAAGYDGRAFRYAAPGVRWFEIDHPATQADKRERIRRLGLQAEGVAFVAADFTVDDVAAGLAAAGHDPTSPSLALCEGVAVYLELGVLESLLRSLRSAAAPGSTLAISLSVSGTGIATRLAFQSAVAALGEPARTTLTAEGARSLLADTGWALRVTGDNERARGAGLVLADAC